ncbi:uncharacterized protein LOC124160293 isoform X2 [Ischnura elegans]|uniref:uncharacterized protein LOC124160293 isoform X2 n=1 Tax=Ischnura elegans TaxID=197161 RepID=UPI001ED89DEC|nr:uncharacterized protein LOC124160293 isoform X2 [Ischnura elegans]
MVAGRELVAKAVALLCFAACTHPYAASKVPDGALRRVPKQIHSKASIINSEDDSKASESFGAASIGANGKYFQDIYVHKYGPDQIEFGHVCENPQEWEQRFERKDGHRRLGKVRWGDKHGGYGEHYYDYNHGGHEGADDESDGHHSEPVPAYNSGPSYNTAAKPSEQVSVYKKAPAVQSAIRPSEPLAYYPQAPTFKVTAKRHLEPETTEYSDEAEAIAAESARVFSQDVARLVKRHPTGAAVAEPEVQASSPKLMFDLATGRVIDEVTGKTYVLQPVN